MFEKLQQKWKVKPLQLFLILCTFAIGGSLCGYLGREVLKFLTIDNDIVYNFAYVFVITLLWPICVLIVSLPFGQFPFFKNYLLKIKNRMFKSST